MDSSQRDENEKPFSNFILVSKLRPKKIFKPTLKPLILIKVKCIIISMDLTL